MRVSRFTLPMLSLLAIGLLALPAAAKNAPQAAASHPNWEPAPLYTTVEVGVGFDNDPRTVTIEAGGEKSAEGVGPNCGGHINWEKPDVDVNYATDKEPGSVAGNEKLSFYVKAETDTTLVVFTPDRKWVCADDTSEANLNPAITFDRPLAGNYNIWVGTFDEGGTKPATLYISEMAPPR